jgi:hypothetical protein
MYWQGSTSLLAGSVLYMLVAMFAMFGKLEWKECGKNVANMWKATLASMWQAY